MMPRSPHLLESFWTHFFHRSPQASSPLASGHAAARTGRGAIPGLFFPEAISSRAQAVLRRLVFGPDIHTLLEEHENRGFSSSSADHRSPTSAVSNARGTKNSRDGAMKHHSLATTPGTLSAYIPSHIRSTTSVGTSKYAGGCGGVPMDYRNCRRRGFSFSSSSATSSLSSSSTSLMKFGTPPPVSEHDGHGTFPASTNRCMIDICIVPLGTKDVSVRNEIAVVEKILRSFSPELEIHLHGYGTNVSGDWDLCMQALKKCHAVLHNELGVPRITTSIRLGTRVDKTQSIAEKITAVEEQL
ncbi:unnamed protein product [Amoebophrya sp. A120]|nr:unnamed protein product [Amoebophrya sp. A120]|eukprot:GSA120T00020032001.1